MKISSCSRDSPDLDGSNDTLIKTNGRLVESPGQFKVKSRQNTAQNSFKSTYYAIVFELGGFNRARDEVLKTHNLTFVRSWL